MPRDGTATRTRIMDAAEAIVLANGFSATTVDRVIDRAGVTKGSFFYHFDSKAALGRALVERFARLDLEHLEHYMERAERLASDPLQQMLVFIGLYREEMAALAEPYPGCLYAAYVQEAGLFESETLAVISDTVLVWRRRLRAKFEEIAARHPPRSEVDFDSLADMLTVLFEGSFIVSKILADPRTVAQQLDHYRAYLELLFGTEGA